MRCDLHPPAAPRPAPGLPGGAGLEPWPGDGAHAPGDGLRGPRVPHPGAAAGGGRGRGARQRLGFRPVARPGPRGDGGLAGPGRDAVRRGGPGAGADHRLRSGRTRGVRSDLRVGRPDRLREGLGPADHALAHHVAARRLARPAGLLPRPARGDPRPLAPRHRHDPRHPGRPPRHLPVLRRLAAPAARRPGPLARPGAGSRGDQPRAAGAAGLLAAGVLPADRVQRGDLRPLRDPARRPVLAGRRRLRRLRRGARRPARARAPHPAAAAAQRGLSSRGPRRPPS